MRLIYVCLLLGVCSLRLAADPRQWGVRGLPLYESSAMEWNGLSAIDEQDNLLLIWLKYTPFDELLIGQLINANGVQQWDSGGRVLLTNSDVAFFSHANLALAHSGNGWVVAWQRSEAAEIRAQKFDNAGNPVWPDNDFSGVVIASLTTVDTYIPPYCLAGPDGSVYIGWHDEDQDDVYLLQRVGDAGGLIWSSPVTVRRKPQHLGFEQIYTSSDGTGNFFALWLGGMQSNEANLAATKVLPSGDRPWGDSVLVTSTPGYRYRVRCLPNGMGGLYAAWAQVGATGYSVIRAQHLNAAGQRLWNLDGLQVCTLNANQNLSTVAASTSGGQPDGILLGWSGGVVYPDRDVYAQKLLSNGTIVWPDTGLHIVGDGTWTCDVAGVASDGAGGAVVIWSDYRINEMMSQVFAARVDQDGDFVWGANNGVLVADGEYLRISRHNHDLHVILEPSHLYPGELHYQGLRSSDGSLLFEQPPLIAQSIFRYGDGPVLLNLEPNRYAAVWRGGLNYQVFDTLGHFELDFGGRAVNARDTVQNWIAAHSACADGNGGFFAAWSGFYSDWPNDSVRLRVLRIDGGGARVGDTLGVTIFSQRKISWHELNPECISDGQGGSYIAWTPQSMGTPQLMVMRVDQLCQPMWPAPATVTGIPLDYYPEPILTQDSRVMLPIRTLDSRAAVVTLEAQSGQVFTEIEILPSLAGVWGARVCSDNAEGMYAVWAKDRLAGTGLDILAQRYDPLGNELWPPGGVLVCGSPFRQQFPGIASNAAGDLFVAWSDDSDNDSLWSIRAQRILSNGILQWPAEGILVDIEGGQRGSPDLITGNQNDVFIRWWRQSACHLTHLGEIADPYWHPDSLSLIGVGWPYAMIPDGFGGVITTWKVESRLYHSWDTVSALVLQRIDDNYALDAEPHARFLPLLFALYQNFPNPFNPATEIRFDLPQVVHAELKVFDLLGREVTTLLDQPLAAGAHHVQFDARSLPSGIYFYRLHAGEYDVTRKMLLLR